MTNETLSARFQREQGKPIVYNGNIVQPIFKQELTEGVVGLSIERLVALENPEQGVRIKVEKGEIELEGRSYNEIILWGSTSPPIVKIKVISKGRSQLKIWNVWRTDGLVNAWVGNAGMTVREISNRYIKFECSDGVGTVDFSDLVFEIRLSDE